MCEGPKPICVKQNYEWKGANNNGTHQGKCQTLNINQNNMGHIKIAQSQNVYAPKTVLLFVWRKLEGTQSMLFQWNQHAQNTFYNHVYAQSIIIIVEVWIYAFHEMVRPWLLTVFNTC